jgi:hypothetical protein
MLNIQRFEPKKKVGFRIGFGWETQKSKNSRNPNPKNPKKSKIRLFFGFLNLKFS